MYRRQVRVTHFDNAQWSQIRYAAIDCQALQKNRVVALVLFQCSGTLLITSYHTTIKVCKAEYSAVGLVRCCLPSIT